jgi:hypothetical protein
LPPTEGILGSYSPVKKNTNITKTKIQMLLGSQNTKKKKKKANNIAAIVHIPGVRDARGRTRGRKLIF